MSSEAAVIVEGALRDSQLLLSIRPPRITKAAQCHVCFVLDISSSMGWNLEGKSEAGPFGKLKRLDIAIHAIKTIIATMSPDDRCSLVTYSDSDQLIFENLVMSEEGKKIAYHKVDLIHANGTTNMWAGMNRAFEILRSTSQEYANQQMMVLTDGANPSIPPDGYVGAMSALKRSYDGHYPCVVHTFGFCYSLDSALLTEIAKEGQGMYAFIPDGTMVGTVFINAFANTAVSVGHQPHVSLEMIAEEESSSETGPRIIQVEGIPKDQFRVQSWGIEMALPVLQSSRTWDLCITLDRPISSLGDIAVALTYKDAQGQLVRSNALTSVDFSAEMVALIRARELVVTAITELVTTTSFDALVSYRDTVLADVPARLRELQTSVSANITVSAAIEGLIQDIAGQVTEALTSLTSYQKWGVHYLLSLRRAHELQQCNNFKDPGIQAYVTELFETVRSAGEECFMRLPNPRLRYSNPGGVVASSDPEPPQTGPYIGTSALYNTASSTPAAPPAAVARCVLPPIDLVPVYENGMSSFMDRYAGCVLGDCVVSLANNQHINISQVRKGDQLVGGRVIRCVVKSSIRPNTKFVQLPGGLVITPWHPVWMSSAKTSETARGSSNDPKGVWQFPCNVQGAKLYTLSQCQSHEQRYMYTFVLEPQVKSERISDNSCSAGIKVNGTTIAVLGHGLHNDPVVSHEFLGTDRVVRALSLCRGFESGEVTVAFTRSGKTAGLDGVVDMN